jgi:flagellar hook-length control protein FliK
MSSNLHPFQPAANPQRGLLNDAASSALSSLSSGGTSDAQAFSRWMSQHREAQQPTLASGLATAQAAGVKSAAATAATNSVQATRHNTMADASQARHQATENHPSVSADKPKAPVKQSQPKPAAKQPAAHHEETKAHAPDESSGKESSDDAKEVSFTTAQGEASAWVKELHPPKELSASDPAAMLAWLASLTHADGVQGQQLDEAASDANGTEASGKAGALTQGAFDGASAKAGHTALADASLLASKFDHLRQSLSSFGAEGAAQGEAAMQDLSAQGGPGGDFSALLARESARPELNASAPTTEANAHITANLDTPIDSPDFAKALADRVSMWVTGSAASGPMTAELHLNPAEMGPIHIRIELDGTQAQVDFAAAQADTRQAIEASMTHLSGALESAGLSLTGGGVSDQGARQAWSGEQGQGQGQGSRPAGWTPEGSRDATRALDGLAPMTRTSVPSRGLAGGLDLYA